jgi:hypothetical protein
MAVKKVFAAGNWLRANPTAGVSESGIQPPAPLLLQELPLGDVHDLTTLFTTYF